MILITSLVLVSFLLVTHYPAFGGSPKGEVLQRMNSASNYYKGKFVNKNPVKTKFSFSETMEMISMFLKGNPQSVPENKIPVQYWEKEDILHLPDSVTTAIWFGHSAFYIKTGGLNILLDPMFGNYPSPFPYLTKRRFNDSLPIQINDLPVIDVVVFSHDHYDHLDYGSILKLKDKVKKFVAPLGVGDHLRTWGVESEKIVEMNWNESIEIQGTSFICTPAQHFSGRGFTNKMSTLWSSWVIKNESSSLFFSGDSGYFEGFKEIGDSYGPFDVCFMECGQYNELWKDIHMFPEETVQAHIDLQGKLLVPIHWGAFSLSVHDWNEPVKRLTLEAQKKGVNATTPIIGEPVTIGNKMEVNDWWSSR